MLVERGGLSPSKQKQLDHQNKNREIISKKVQNTLISVTFDIKGLDDLSDNLLLMSCDSKQFNSFNGNIISMFWLINGYFMTDKSQNFITDIKKRFALTLGSAFIDCEFKSVFSSCGVELKDIARELKSISDFNYTNKKTRSHFPPSLFVGYDSIFWSLKDDIEAMIKSRNKPLNADEFAEYAVKNYGNLTKDKSTARAKARSIFNWYKDRNFKTYSYDGKKYERKYKTENEIKELAMTRRENALKMSSDKKRKNHALIKGFISDSLFASEYKLKNGSWNISKLAKDLKMSRNTIYYHLGALGEIQPKFP